MYRILVVEDDRDSRVGLHKFLALKGHLVESVGDVPGAVKALAWNPQVVLLDLMLPGVSGLGLVDHLRRLNPVPRLAFVSANVPPLIPDYDPAPVYFRKPIDVHRLTDWIADPTSLRLPETT